MRASWLFIKSTQGDSGLDLREYLRILRQNWILITAITLAGLLIGGAASVLAKPTYTAETQLFVSLQNSGSIQELQQGNTFSQARVQSYVETAGTPLVLQPAIDALGLDLTPAQLASRVKASNQTGTVLITITVSDNSPVQAAAIAESTANSLIRVVDSLEKPKTGGPSPVSLSVVTPAQVPPAPSGPNTRLNLLLGLALGLMLGLVVAILRNSLDTQIRGENDLRKVTEYPLLGRISFDHDAVKNPLLTQSGPQGPRAESFRQLRTNLEFANISGQAKSILVTSSLPGEGKSTTATNLAIAIAQAGQTVCLVDADLRRPMVNEYLGLDRNVGLTTALLGSNYLDDVLQPWGEENLYVLTSGQIPPNPSELLGSKEMKQLLDELESTFDTVIIDAPPLLPVTDAAVLSRHGVGVLLVVGAQKLREQDLAKSITALDMVKSDVLGIVLNRIAVKGPDAYAYSYYSSEEYSPQARTTSIRRSSKSKMTKSVLAPTSAYDREPSFFPADSQGVSQDSPEVKNF